jgi:hypothetical protein
MRRRPFFVYAMEADPFTQLHAELEAMLQRSPAMRKAMGPKIKNFGSTYDVNTEADVPRIILEPTGGPGNINAASGYVTMEYTYNVLIDSGNQDIAKVLNPVLWALFAAIASALAASGLTALQWRGKSFVKHFAIGSANVGVPNPQLQLGMRGMTAVCAIAFSLGFNKNDLAAFAAGE